MPNASRIVVAIVSAAAVAAVAHAGTTTGSMSVSVSIAAAAKLVLSSSTVSFPNADPDVLSLVPASEGFLTVTAKTRTSSGSTVTLTVLAAGDLDSGTNTIPVTNVVWTASGHGFVNGALSRTIAQAVGSWTGSGERIGQQGFGLMNSWAYATGTYTAMATYTLTAP